MSHPSLSPTVNGGGFTENVEVQSVIRVNTLTDGT